MIDLGKSKKVAAVLNFELNFLSKRSSSELGKTSFELP